VTKPRLFLRLDLARGVRLGPGKIRLLEEIARQGSISAAGRAMKMSYRRAWLLVDDLNASFRAPVVTTRLGGAGGGKASVTALGRAAIRAYRALERDAQRIFLKRSAALVTQLRGSPRRPKRSQPRGLRGGT
jgi:molybdate transport system regulatory protein